MRSLLPYRPAARKEGARYVGVLAFEWRQHCKRKLAASQEGKQTESPPKSPPGWLSANSIGSWIFRVVLSVVVAAVSSAALPAALFLAGAVLVMLIAIGVVPFQVTGKEAAVKFCTQGASTEARIFVKCETGASDWGYRVGCNGVACALIRDGKVFVVPVESVEHIELAVGDRSSPKSSEASSDVFAHLLAHDDSKQ